MTSRFSTRNRDPSERRIRGPPPRARAIKDIFLNRINTTHAEVIDRRARYASHAEVQPGGGRSFLLIVAGDLVVFGGIGAQGLFYQALEEMMGKDIHVITMRTLTAQRWNTQTG